MQVEAAEFPVVEEILLQLSKCIFKYAVFFFFSLLDAFLYRLRSEDFKREPLISPRYGLIQVPKT
jgi:hypothetical protein